VTCTICGKRKAARYCPAKGESICAVCCGTGREVTIDCVADCTYLIAAHRYEDEHPRGFSPEMPFYRTEVRSDIHHTHAQFTAAILHNVVMFCASHPEIRDSDVLMAVQALAETYKTLAAGIYYENPPTGRSAGELYAFLQEFFRKIKEEMSKHAARNPRVTDDEIFQLLVLLYRHAYWQSNGRPLSRRFIELLRQQFPDSPGTKAAESRIIVP